MATIRVTKIKHMLKEWYGTNGLRGRANRSPLALPRGGGVATIHAMCHLHLPMVEIERRVRGRVESKMERGSS